MKSYETYIWAGSLIVAGILIVYLILPKLFKNYQTEKGIKLLIFYAMMGYLSYDFYLKEKYLYILFFAIGAAVFTYLVVIAKRK